MAEVLEAPRLDRIDGWPLPEEQADWVGAPAAEEVLRHAYASGTMHHAWLIGGRKGIGKATLAYRFARFILANPDYRHLPPERGLGVPPESVVFRKVAARSHPNVLSLERPWDHDKKRFRTQVTVDEIRRTIPFFGSTAGEGAWRIAIVDSADEMNPSAANALLKILEEPPTRSLILVLAHAPGRLLPTIRSRCQRLTLHPLPKTTIAAALDAGGAGESDADRELAADLSGGSLRRAILLTESDGLERYRALTGLLARLPALDVGAMHAFADSVARRGADDAYVSFLDLLFDWLSRRVHGEPEPGNARLSPAAAATPLERWAEVWENFQRSAADAEELNLDRKQVLLSVFMALARATRM